MPIAAPTRGCSGVVTIASTYSGTYTAIARLSNWSFDTVSERIDASVMGSCQKSYVAGATETTGSIECQWDGDDATQVSLTNGSTRFIRIYPEGTGSTANFYRTTTSGAVITNVRRSGNGVDGVVSVAFDFAANGGLTATAVP